MSEDSPFHRGSRIDRAIDRAVHEMVQRDPPPSLRRRVLARIERKSHARIGWVPVVTLTTVALAVIGIVAGYLRPQPPRASPAESEIAGTPPEPSVLAKPLRKAEAQAAPAVAGSRSRATDTLIPMPRIRNVFTARADQATGASVDTWQMTALSDTAPPSDRAAGERIDALTSPVLRTTAITIAPLDIEQLQIPPLRK